MRDLSLLFYNNLLYLEAGFSQQKTLLKSLISHGVQAVE